MQIHGGCGNQGRRFYAQLHTGRSQWKNIGSIGSVFSHICSQWKENIATGSRSGLAISNIQVQQSCSGIVGKTGDAGELMDIG